MNVDFHTHAKITKSQPFCIELFIKSLEEAKKSNLQAIALTEHFNTENFLEIYETLDKRFSYQDDFYYVNGMKVFPGVEVNAKEGGHFTFIGSRYDVREFWEKIKLNQTEDSYLPILEILEIAEPYNFIKIGAHPYRKPSAIIKHSDLVFEKLDALGLNGKDLYQYGRKSKDKLTLFAYGKNLPLLAGSDTHQYLQYGCVYNKFHENLNTIDELKQAISSDLYDIIISSDLEIKVKSATVVKKILKKLLLDGNYDIAVF